MLSLIVISKILKATNTADIFAKRLHGHLDDHKGKFRMVGGF
jgi:hypothetical protein